MSAKGWRGILTRADDVPPTADVIDLPVQRPSADSLFEAVRSAQRERRQIEKEGRAIMQRLSARAIRSGLWCELCAPSPRL